MRRAAVFVLTTLQMLFLSGCITISDLTAPAAQPASEFVAAQPGSGDAMRGVWVATVCNIDFPSSNNLDRSALMRETDALLDACAAEGLTDVFLQVRPCSDALYASALFPASAFLVPNQGDDLPLDVLEYAVEQAHARGLKLHAWLNPYRITTPSPDAGAGWGFERLSADHPARQNPDCVVRHRYESDGRTLYALYYDPGNPDTVRLVLDGAEEILARYDVDGLHIDDYFYPPGSDAFDDAATYAAYGGGMPLGDWRRENTQTLVRGLCELARRYGVRFGVSPGGVWARQSEALPDGVPGLGATAQTYYDAYADSLAWVRAGIVDYICPQIYWETGHASAPFQTVAAWWNDRCAETGVDFYAGIAAYKGAARVGAFASPGEIADQLAFLQTLPACRGAVYYSYQSLKSANVREAISIFKREQP